ncbi:hypothetical protein BV22DRAFT_1041307 [Leucogyrophana mollusca]|uniref:Uncharacterized protein n=1 Tax=Leucogyrophana mollusca TaxID=85980 RepID=A0ACB8B189_9AGAM|nr:hypothetical protein BV22DRAFT_1041307 [Leucogyrophana mollusca]
MTTQPHENNKTRCSRRPGQVINASVLVHIVVPPPLPLVCFPSSLSASRHKTYANVAIYTPPITPSGISPLAQEYTMSLLDYLRIYPLSIGEIYQRGEINDQPLEVPQQNVPLGYEDTFWAELEQAFTGAAISQPLVNTYAPTLPLSPSIQGDSLTTPDAPNLSLRQTLGASSLVHFTQATTTHGCQFDCNGSPCHTSVIANRLDVARHLRLYHNIKRNSSRVSCLWDGCMKEIRADSLSRHIVNCHMNATLGCPRCFKMLSSVSSLRRHRQTGCGAKRDAS